MRKNILKKVFGLSLLILLICVTSCSKTETTTAPESEVSKSDKPNGIKVTSTKINGPLGEYFEVVDKNYKFHDNHLNVEIKRIAEGGPKFASHSSKIQFSLSLMDEDEDVIDTYEVSTTYAGHDEILNPVLSLGVDESTTMEFLFLGEKTDARKIKMSSSWDGKEGASDESIESGASSESSFSASNVILPSQLKGKVSVVSASKSVNSYGYPEVSVTFKLLSKVNTKSMCSSYGQMWIVGVGQNASGVDVKELLPNYKEWRSDDSDGDQFKSFLEGSPGETITLDFTGSKDNSNNVSADLAKVAKFKLKITN